MVVWGIQAVGVCFSPSVLALSFISSTKSAGFPPQKQAKATAASLPEDSMSPYSSSWTVSTSPSFRYMEDPSMPTASLGIR